MTHNRNKKAEKPLESGLDFLLAKYMDNNSIINNNDINNNDINNNAKNINPGPIPVLTARELEIAAEERELDRETARERLKAKKEVFNFERKERKRGRDAAGRNIKDGREKISLEDKSEFFKEDYNKKYAELIKLYTPEQLQENKKLYHQKNKEAAQKKKEKLNLLAVKRVNMSNNAQNNSENSLKRNFDQIEDNETSHHVTKKPRTETSHSTNSSNHSSSILPSLVQGGAPTLFAHSASMENQITEANQEEANNAKIAAKNRRAAYTARKQTKN